MPMTVEMCRNCGCSEFAHHLDTEEGQDCYEGTWSCDCGNCSELEYIDEPDDLVCICGCLARTHERDGTGPCLSHEHCGAFEENGTVLDRVRAEVEARSGCGPEVARAPRKVRSQLQLDWLDEPLDITAALVEDDDGQIVRVDGPPQPGDDVFVYLAVTSDGLEIAVSSHELVG
ncbi:MAG: hypothetical protein R2714_17320 [Microthrixaceae bacterium]|nr:hypothetical protein [Planctomycetota bacterium]